MYITIVVTVIICYTVTVLYCIGTVISGSLSLCHGASSGWRWAMTFTWRVAADILNKQSQTADKGWSSILGVGRGANKSSPSKLAMLHNI